MPGHDLPLLAAEVDLQPDQLLRAGDLLGRRDLRGAQLDLRELGDVDAVGRRAGGARRRGHWGGAAHAATAGTGDGLGASGFVSDTRSPCPRARLRRFGRAGSFPGPRSCVVATTDCFVLSSRLVLASCSPGSAALLLDAREERRDRPERRPGASRPQPRSSGPGSRSPRPSMPKMRAAARGITGETSTAIEPHCLEQPVQEGVQLARRAGSLASVQGSTCTMRWLSWPPRSRAPSGPRRSRSPRSGRGREPAGPDRRIERQVAVLLEQSLETHGRGGKTPATPTVARAGRAGIFPSQ